jgi:hypothetical protein
LAGLDPAHHPEAWMGSLSTDTQSDSLELSASFRSSATTNEVAIHRKYYRGWPDVDVVDTDQIVEQRASISISASDMSRIYESLITAITDFRFNPRIPDGAGWHVTMNVVSGSSNIIVLQDSLEGHEPILQTADQILQIVESYNPEYRIVESRQ